MLTCRIAELRRAKGLTQAELGRLVGKTGAAIGQYEKQVRDPDTDTLFALARELGVEVGDLYRDGPAAANE